MNQETSTHTSKRLSHFIHEQMEPILGGWETVARTLPSGKSMSTGDLCDHTEKLLVEIAGDLQTEETEARCDTKSKGLGGSIHNGKFAAAREHGEIRHLHGFDLSEVCSEFRALRATVLSLWKEQPTQISAKAMEEIARFNQAIDQALSESISSHSAKTAESREIFMAVLGHDLRGPLSTMNSCLQLLYKPETPPQSRGQMFQIGTRSIAHMDGLITDLLEYTRTRLGRGIEVSPKSGDFNVLCQEVFEEARMAHPKHRFVYKTAGDLSAAFDSARMKQVLGNLLNNAVQHGDPESPILMDVAEDGDSIRITITNQGAPIPCDAMQTIFEPLVQLTKPQATTREGRSSLGLGLFIARQIVTAHGGTIDVTSSPERGTVFTVLMPKTAKTT